jgi:hypothetical protein
MREDVELILVVRRERAFFAMFVVKKRGGRL